MWVKWLNTSTGSYGFFEDPRVELRGSRAVIATANAIRELDELPGRRKDGFLNLDRGYTFTPAQMAGVATAAVGVRCEDDGEETDEDRP